MATNYVKASYTEVIDLQTTNGKTSVIGLHTPVGRRPYDRLNGFFNQFKKYKYKGISSLVMVPAAQLPVDPLGLTGVTGTTDLMDPRDALNPILFHGCHGENLSGILDTIYSNDEYVQSNGTNTSYGGRNVSDSASESEINNATIGAYYKCLTDVTWRKFGIQNGVKLKGLHPLVHKLAMNTPMIPGLAGNGAGANSGQLIEYEADANGAIEKAGYPPSFLPGDLVAPMNPTGNVNTHFGTNITADGVYAQQFTNGMTRLGWMPTTKMDTNNATKDPEAIRSIAALPKLFMGVLILPPSYNVEQYFRMVIRHEFEFSEFTTSLGAMADSIWGANADKTNNSYFNWIDYGSKDAKVDNIGDSIDMIGGNSEVISDGVA